MSAKRKAGDDGRPDGGKKGKGKGKATGKSLGEKVVAASFGYKFDWMLMPRRPFRRGFGAYWAGELGPEEGARRRKLYGIVGVEDPAGEEVTPIPIDSFEEAGVLPPWLLEAMREHDRYDDLTPLQAQAVPIALTGTNVVGVAPSVADGNEATSYLAPAVMHAEDQMALSEKEPGPIVLIIVASDAAATRVVAEATRLLKHASRSLRHFNGMRAVSVCGGGLRSAKIKELSKIGAHIVVGTPKRIHDMAAKEQMSLLRVTFLVIDGAEKMVAKGYLQELRDVAGWVRPERQTMLLASTWPKTLKDLTVDTTFTSGSPVHIKCLGKRPAVATKGADVEVELEVEEEAGLTAHQVVPHSNFGCPKPKPEKDEEVFPEDW
mmetsp:Transcript_91845/g.259971  ORF Transcript_91845/g.259971 Transcript_91845/m.259971 type:complete len:377 (+) Transcript_91845:89-1219(+)